MHLVIVILKTICYTISSVMYILYIPSFLDLLVDLIYQMEEMKREQRGECYDDGFTYNRRWSIAFNRSGCGSSRYCCKQ